MCEDLKEEEIAEAETQACIGGESAVLRDRIGQWRAGGVRAGSGREPTRATTATERPQSLFDVMNDFRDPFEPRMIHEGSMRHRG